MKRHKFVGYEEIGTVLDYSTSNTLVAIIVFLLLLSVVASICVSIYPDDGRFKSRKHRTFTVTGLAIAPAILFGAFLAMGGQHASLFWTPSTTTNKILATSAEKVAAQQLSSLYGSFTFEKNSELIGRKAEYRWAVPRVYKISFTPAKEGSALTCHGQLVISKPIPRSVVNTHIPISSLPPRDGKSTHEVVKITTTTWC